MVFRLGIGLSVIPASSRPAPTSAPVNEVAPSISGILTQGQTLTADPGEWSQLPSPVFTYQWKRSAVNISGATAATYVPDADDVAAGASAITVTVTATNDLGATNATSAGVTIAATLTITGTPGAGTVGVAYSFTPSSAGGHTPKTYALTGTLPSGLGFSTSTGAISGTPTTSETASGLDITVTDADGLTASLGTFAITVSAASAAEIDSVEVVGASPLLDQTNDYGDATSRTGVNFDGGAAKIVYPDDGVSTIDPTKLVFTVQDPGYDATGSTTVERTIRGTAILRRQWTAETSRMNSAAASTRTTFVALEDDIYDGSTIVSVEAEAGWYGAADAGMVSSVVNSSTLAYEKAQAAWNVVQHQRATGDFAVEMAATHRHMRNGRQVARIEFIARDTTGNAAATQTAGGVSLSALQTQGNIAEVYKATIPLTALNQGELCFVNAKVYPWIGDSTAVLDLLVDGTNTTGAVTTATCQTPLRFLNDKTGAYGGAYAYVKAGASGGTVSTTAATAQADPYPTINAAIAAIRTYNNANKSHDDHSGGIVRLMEDSLGAGANHSTANSGVAAGMSSIAAGLCMTVIEVDPDATGAVKMTMATTRTTADLLHWKVDIDHTAGNGLDGSTVPNDKRNAYSDLTVDLSGTTTTVPICYRVGLHYLQNVTFDNVGSDAGRVPGSASLTERTRPALHSGVIVNGQTGNKILAPFAVIGGRYPRTVFTDVNLASITTWESNDGAVFVNNIMRDVRALHSLGTTQSKTRGMGIVQNVIERTTGSTGCLNIGADGALQPIANIVEAYNTYPGLTGQGIARVNGYYADEDAASGVIKRGIRRFCLLHQVNSKRDTFTNGGALTATGRVGSWKFNYNVGNLGNVVSEGSASGSAPDLDGGTWLGEWWPAATYNVGAANVTFTDNQSGVAGAGGGTYTLTGAGNAARNQVPTGLAGLSYDLAGVARKNDGTGAAGAYEYV